MPYHHHCRLGFWLAALAALMTGCSASGPAFKPMEGIPADRGVVYLYSPSDSTIAGDATVKVNKIPITRIQTGGYFPYVGTPGSAYFQIGPDAANITYVRVEAGKEKYLRASDLTGRLKFAPVAPKEGRQEIAQCALLAPLQAGPGEAPAARTALPSASAPADSRTKATSTHPRPRKPAGAMAKRAAPPVGSAGLAGKVVGPLSFEAERIAMARGCTTRDGVRPAAFLVEQTDSLQVYDIACRETSMRVACQFQYCQWLGR